MKRTSGILLGNDYGDVHHPTKRTLNGELLDQKRGLRVITSKDQLPNKVSTSTASGSIQISNKKPVIEAPVKAPEPFRMKKQSKIPSVIPPKEPVNVPLQPINVPQQPANEAQ